MPDLRVHRCCYHYLNHSLSLSLSSHVSLFPSPFKTIVILANYLDFLNLRIITTATIYYYHKFSVPLGNPLFVSSCRDGTFFLSYFFPHQMHSRDILHSRALNQLTSDVLLDLPRKISPKKE